MSKKPEKAAPEKVLKVDYTAAEKKKILMQKAASINKTFKKQVLTMADKAPDPYFMRRPTGIMELDIDLAGGFPPGISYISGPDGAGKSHLLYRMMAMHQRIYGEKASIALAAVEAPIDHFFLRKLGVIVAVPEEVIEERDQYRKERGLPRFTKEERKEFARQVGTFWNITGGTMEETLQCVLDILTDPTMRAGDMQFGIIGIDSVNALMPSAYADLDLDEHGRMAAHASCLTRFFSSYYPLSTGGEGEGVLRTSIIFTNQVRSNAAKAKAQAHIAKNMSDYAAAPGAYAAKHGKLIDVMIWPGEKKKEENKLTGGKSQTIQKVLSWEFLKGKAGVHEGKTGEVLFDFTSHDFIDLQRSIVVSGMRLGVFVERGGLITFIEPHTQTPSETIKDVPFDFFVQQLRDDPALELQMRLEVLAAAKIQCRYV